ncbi:MAG: SLC13 family permease [Desulfuromonadales bacterium]
MGLEAIITIIVVLLMLLALVLELYAPDVIVFSALGFLILFGIVTPKEALVGFSNEGMLTVAILFVVAYAAQSSGILEVFANRVMGRSGGGRRSLLRLMLPVWGLSAFLNNTPIVSMFTPTIRDWALRHKLAPSKFLIPLSYASIFGGTCTLIGTSTNLVVHGMLQEQLGLGFSMFELAWVGIPCAFGGMIFILAFGNKLLPDRRDLSADFGEKGREYVLEMMLSKESNLIGKSVEEAGLRNLDHVFLVQILRNGNVVAPVRPTDRLEEGDRLFFAGLVEGIVQVGRFSGLTPCHEGKFCSAVQKSGKGRVVEAVVSRSSPMLDKTLKEGNFRSRYDAAVLAVHRHGEKMNTSLGQLKLRPGDTLLLLTGEDFTKRWSTSRDFYMVSRSTVVPEINRRKTYITLVTLLGMILLAASGVMDIFAAAVLASVILMITRTVTAVEARRSLEINVLVVIACAFGISKALDKTGVASEVAKLLITAAHGLGPVGLLAAIYLVTSLMTELITNNAAAALVFPIAMASAAQSGLNPMPFAVAIAIAASASFATPIGYQTNLMVYGPGGYRFTDFFKIGIPMNLMFMVVAIIVIPLVWKF